VCQICRIEAIVRKPSTTQATQYLPENTELKLSKNSPWNAISTTYRYRPTYMHPCHQQDDLLIFRGNWWLFREICGFFFPTTKNNGGIVTLDKEGGHLVSCALTHFLAGYSGQITNDIWDT
jgi:hypothetical protein